MVTCSRFGLVTCLLFFPIATLSSNAAPLVANGAFDLGASGWSLSGNAAITASDVFAGSAIEHPGQGSVAVLSRPGASISQAIDLTGLTAFTLSFDYLMAAWDVGAGSGSSAPGFSPSHGHDLTVRVAAGGGAEVTEVFSLDDPWDGSCPMMAPDIPLPVCSDGTPTVGTWSRFTRRFVSATPFTAGTELSFATLEGFPWNGLMFYFDEHFKAYIDNVSVDVTEDAVPEPVAGLLLGVGLALWARGRRVRAA
jgi:hypothetical protein